MRRDHGGSPPAILLALVALAGLLVGGCAADGAAAGSDASESAGPATDSSPEPTVPPRVDRLSNGFETIYALGSAILDGIQAGDHEALMSYAIDEAEWYHIVWPELPASRPGRNLPWEYAWGDLSQKSAAAARRAIRDFEGRSLRLVRIEFAGETTDYDTYEVHRDARHVVEREDGEIVTLDLFGSVIERNGRFKAFSYVVD